jgi:hypothetical protein
MPHSTSRTLRAAIASAIVLVLSSLALAACGSSSSSSAKTSASAATAKAAGTAGAPARFAAIRECLQKDGIVLPKRTPGGRPSGKGFLPGGAPQLPQGVSPQRYQAAIRKCGGLARPIRPGAGARLKSPAFKHALANFAACLRRHGIRVPPPNTSGRGPVFDTSGIDTAGAKFKAGREKCAGILSDTFRKTPGGSAAPGG